MKSIAKIVVLLAIIAFVPTASYALIDAEAYGGAFWGGQYYSGATAQKVNVGKEYGFRGHLNFGIPLLFKVGVGMFYNKAPLKYKNESSGNEYKITIRDLGIDAYAMLELPIFIHPFARMGLSVKQDVKVEEPQLDGNTKSNEYSRKFRSSYYGGGAAISILPYIRIYGEYIYTISKLEDGKELSGNAFHLGAMLSI